MRPTNQDFRMVLAVGCIGLLLLLAGRLRADDDGQGPCIPTVSDYDSAYGFASGDYALIWWCTEADGLRAYWWTDSKAKGSLEAVLRLAGRDPDEFRRQLEHRWSTVEQISLAMQVQREQGPRCWTGKIEVSCLSWRMVDGQRMCEVSGRIQADGSSLPDDSWVACELAKAPQGGWK